MENTMDTGVAPTTAPAAQVTAPAMAEPVTAPAPVMAPAPTNNHVARTVVVALVVGVVGVAAGGMGGFYYEMKASEAQLSDLENAYLQSLTPPAATTGATASASANPNPLDVKTNPFQ